MTTDNKKSVNEISIYEILLILWQEKLKIFLISLVCTLVFGYYMSTKPNVYQISTDIRPGNSSSFVKYNLLNEILTSNIVNTSGLVSENKYLTNNVHLLDAQSIFFLLLNEYSDYEEVLFVLQQNPYVKSKIGMLEGDELQMQLAKYAKSFSIQEQKDENYKIILNWHDRGGGLEIMNKILIRLVESIRKKIIIDIKQLANSIDEKHAFQLNTLEIKLKNLEETQDEALNKRIKFLKEQASIAKELGITESQIEDLVSFNNNSYFLRGSNKINKEIELVKRNSFEVTEEYLLTKYKMKEIQKDITSKELLKSIETIKNDNIKDWVGYNFSFADTKITEKPLKVYLIYGFIFGIIFGSAIILILRINRHMDSIVKLDS